MSIAVPARRGETCVVKIIRPGGEPEICNVTPYFVHGDDAGGVSRFHAAVQNGPLAGGAIQFPLEALEKTMTSESVEVIGI
jgi:hypothetical protein